MNYIIDDEMLETFKNSLRLNRKYATALISVSNPQEAKRHQEAIESIDIILEELNKLKSNS